MIRGIVGRAVGSAAWVVAYFSRLSGGCGQPAWEADGATGVGSLRGELALRLKVVGENLIEEEKASFRQ